MYQIFYIDTYKYIIWGRQYINNERRSEKLLTLTWKFNKPCYEASVPVSLLVLYFQYASKRKQRKYMER